MEYPYKLNQRKKTSLGEKLCSLSPDQDREIVKIVKVKIRKF
jgi:hypothetical protein